MTDPITPETLAALEALRESATADEWTAFLVKEQLFHTHLSSVRSIEGYAIALDLKQADATYIVSVCNAFPALAAALRLAWAENEKLRRVIVDLTQKHDWENYMMSDETESVMRELYPFSELADKKEPCPKCGQTLQGQTGEYPCELCGLPTMWDDETPKDQEPSAPFITERAEYDAQISDLRYGGCK
jgi:hypothetical protein